MGLAVLAVALVAAGQAGGAVGDAPTATVRATLVGMNDGDSGGFDPPDVQVAAGPGFVVELVNTAERVWRDGAGGSPQVVQTAPLSQLFRTGDRLTDPRILYDASSGRWFVSISDEDRKAVLLAVSRSDDPTAAWSISTFAASGCADQPRLGVADGVVVIGADIFANCTEGIQPSLGAQLWVVSKQQLLDGVATPSFSTSGPDRSIATYAPVQSLSPTQTEYVVAVDNPVSSVVHLIGVVGTPPAAVRVQTVASLGIPTLVAPQDGLQPPSSFGSQPTIPTNDDRILDSVWENGKLWFSANTSCVPTGDGALRACGRIVELSTTQPAVDWSLDLGQPNASIYFPALRPDASGNLVIAYGESSQTTLPELVVQGRAPDGTLTAPVVVDQSSALHVGDRYGDYFGAARDPANPALVWVAGEVGRDLSSGRGWDTAVASVQVAGPAVAPPTLASAPPPRVRAQRVSARAGSVVLLSYMSLDEGIGVRIQVTVQRSKNVVFRATTSTATVHANHLYSVRWRPARTLRGSFSFCVRSVGSDETRSAQSCAPLTVR